MINMIECMKFFYNSLYFNIGLYEKPLFYELKKTKFYSSFLNENTFDNCDIEMK